MNILFIGDFRPAANYGSIATTECLLDMVYPLLSDNDHLRIIDRRSYDRQTPPTGFKSDVIPKYKRFIRKVIPLKVRSLIRLKKEFVPCCIEDFRKKEHIPSLFSEYDWYSSQILYSENNYEKMLLEWADFVLINGEGTIVKGTDKYGVYNRGGRYTIWMAYAAKKIFKKPACLVNLTVDPGNRDGLEMVKNVFPLVDYLSTREPLSKIKLEDIAVNNALYVPDALFSYTPQGDWHPTKYLSSIIDFSQPYVVLGDSTALNRNPFQDGVRWNVVSTYTTIYLKLKETFSQVVFLDGFNGKNESINRFIKKNHIKPIRLKNTTYHDLYHVFKHSKLFISGRWHASILATLSSTPILLYGSDSHKTKALYAMLDYSYPFFETQTIPLHINELIDNAVKITEDNNIREQIKEKVAILKIESHKNVDYLRDFLFDNRLKQI